MNNPDGKNSAKNSIGVLYSIFIFPIFLINIFILLKFVYLFCSQFFFFLNHSPLECKHHEGRDLRLFCHHCTLKTQSSVWLLTVIQLTCLFMYKSSYRLNNFKLLRRRVYYFQPNCTFWNCFLRWSYQFTQLLAVDESSQFFTFSWANVTETLQ